MPTPELLSSQHHPAMVAASFVLAVLASFVALDLARRMRQTDRLLAGLWWVSGSLAMGTGIWSTHFVGMLGFEPGIALGYRLGPTVVSWLAALAAAGVALAVATRARLTPRLLVLGSGAMAAGICAMHYTGMAALDLAPGPIWDPLLVAASVAVALVASAAALGLFFVVRRMHGRARLARQGGASLLMGLAICGMHYTGMAAVAFPTGTVCLSADDLGGPSLGLAVGGATLLMLGLALMSSLHDARRQRREATLAKSLLSANQQLLAANQRLHGMAFHDALTGLPNRLLFEERLQQAGLRRRHPTGGSATLAVLFIDLDGFKPINDSFGHAAGDQVLVAAAGRLRDLLPDDGRDAARIGGDEFVALVEADDATAAAQSLAARALAALVRPFAVDGRQVTLSCSIGIAPLREPDDASRLLAQADAAMYAAKRKGGSGWAVFEPAMDRQAAEQVALQEDLRRAIERGELSLHHQPQFDSRDGQLRGVEALLRWQHPLRGMVSPALFIPVAERFGLIGQIGHWVIEQACAQLGQWKRRGWHGRLSVNLSAYQLREADLAARIGAAIERHGLDPRQLVCEITESTLIENMLEGQPAIDALVALGVSVSIDDFGTGYSSLAYLRRLPADELKIDRSLVHDVATSHEARAIVAAVTQLAHALDMHVVAEGVETEAQRQALATLQCDRLQGYLLARPMTADALWERVLQSRAGHAEALFRVPGSAAADTVARKVATA